jgi:hypothetical protein
MECFQSNQILIVSYFLYIAPILDFDLIQMATLIMNVFDKCFHVNMAAHSIFLFALSELQHDKLCNFWCSFDISCSA